MNRIDKVPITRVRMSAYLRYLLRTKSRSLVQNGGIHLSLANMMDKGSQPKPLAFGLPQPQIAAHRKREYRDPRPVIPKSGSVMQIQPGE